MKSISVVFFALLFSLFVQGAFAQHSPTQVQPPQQEPGYLGIPAFEFVNVYSGETITPANLDAKHARVFFFYDPTCDHCMKTAQNIMENEQAMKDIQLIWITKPNPDANAVKKFQDTYFAKTTLKVYFLGGKNSTYFGNINQMPTAWVYDCNGKFATKLVSDSVNARNIVSVLPCK